jgi:glycosyltransferase involved in cell wall biosynthesis
MQKLIKKQNKKMKIAFITDCIRNEAAGIGNYAKGLIWNLKKLSNTKIEYVFIDYKVTHFNKKKVKLIENPFPIAHKYLWYNLIALLLRKEKYEYVFNFNMIPHLIPFVQKEVFVVHDMSMELFPELFPWKRVFMHKILMKHTLKNANKILVNSDNTKADLVDYFPEISDKISKYYAPTEYKKNPYTKPYYINKTPYILCLNTLEPRKNMVFAIHVFEKTKKYYKIPHNLVIAGKKGWMYKDIYKTREASRYKKSIIMPGYVTEDEKNYLYRNAALFFYPSIYEGIGIPVLEAINAGCPVVTSNSSSMLEYAKKQAHFINPNNEDQAVKIIIKIIKRGRNPKSLNENKKRVNLSSKKETGRLIDFLGI